MKEKLDERKTQTCFSKEIQFWKIRKRQRKIKKKELKLTFFEKGKEKRRSFQKEQDYVSVRM